MRIVVALLFCLSFAAACGKKAPETAVERAVENAMEKEGHGKTDVRISDKGFSLKTEKGAVSLQTGNTATIPKAFPSDIHVFKGASVQMAMQTPEGFMVSLSTSKDVSSVAAEYEKQMTKAGWIQKNVLDMGGQKVLMYDKASREATIMIGTAKNATQIAITTAN